MTHERLFCVCSDGKEGLGTLSQPLCQSWQGRPSLHWVLLPGHAAPPGNWGWGEGSWGFPRSTPLPQGCHPWQVPMITQVVPALSPHMRRERWGKAGGL